MALTDSMIESLLERYPSGSAEERYHRALLDLLTRIDFGADSREEGEGLLLFLTQGRLKTASFDLEADPVGGSVEENAALVAGLFSSVEADPVAWKAKFPTPSSHERTAMAAKRWAERFREIPDVLLAEF
ncbi:MAG: hypothetical protein ACPGID_11375 [Rubricella sp.]